MEGNSDVGDQNGNNNNNKNKNNNHNINNNANKIHIYIVNGGNLSPIWNDRRLLKTCFVAVVLAVAVPWFMGWPYYSITVPLSLPLAILARILDEWLQQREQNHRRGEQNHRRGAQKRVRLCGDVGTVALQHVLEYLDLVNSQGGNANLQDLKGFLVQKSREEFLWWWVQRYGDIQESDGPSTTPNYSNRQSTDTVPT